MVGGGVGGIEAEAGMLGQPVYFLTPDVVGVNLTGTPQPGVTATDVVLTITEMLRKAKVVGKFVEFHGEGAANLSAAERDWLLAVAEFDRREGWAQWGVVSCAAWLSWQVSLDLRAAREKVRVARSLAKFPLISEAMGNGSLSYSKVRAITRIAEPATERSLVAMALAGTTNHVERMLSG